MTDPATNRRIEELERRMERLADLEQIQANLPLRMERIWGAGMMLSIDPRRETDPIVEVVNGSISNGVFDCQLDVRDNPTAAWSAKGLAGNDFPPVGMGGNLAQSVWVIDLANAGSLAAGDRYTATSIGAEPGGPYYKSILDNNRGNPLSNATWWLKLDGTASPSSGYAGDVMYAKGQYVQEIRPLYAIRSISALGGTQGGCSNSFLIYRTACESGVNNRYQAVVTISCPPTSPVVGPWVFESQQGCCTCGSGSGSGSGSGQGSIGGACISVLVNCCAVPVPCKLCATVSSGGASNGTYNLTWSSGSTWTFNDPIGSCSAASMTLICNPDGTTLYMIRINGVKYASSQGQCNPFSATFSSVDLSGCGGGIAATITIKPGSCGGTTTVVCCGPAVPNTLCVTFGGSMAAVHPVRIVNQNAVGQPNNWAAINVPMCGSTGNVSLACSTIDNSWVFTAGVRSNNTNNPGQSVVCSPLLGTFSGSLTVSDSCDGNWTATVSADLTACGGGGGGGGGGGDIGTACCPADLLPEELFLAFGGSLAGMGTLKFVWDARSQTWLYSAATSCDSPRYAPPISFFCSGRLNDPGATFILNRDLYYRISGKPISCNPFLWSGSGTMVGGPCQGNFTVTASP